MHRAQCVAFIVESVNRIVHTRIETCRFNKKSKHCSAICEWIDDKVPDTKVQFLDILEHTQPAKTWGGTEKGSRRGPITERSRAR